jgi:hypothetical protein
MTTTKTVDGDVEHNADEHNNDVYITSSDEDDVCERELMMIMTGTIDDDVEDDNGDEDEGVEVDYKIYFTN